MIQKIKNKLLILASLLMIAVPAMVPVAAHAASSAGSPSPSLVDNNLCNGSNFNITTDSSSSSCPESGSTGGINGLLKKVVNVISAVVGVVAVIMIIVGGFKYITSGGDSNNVSSAKNTIIYAIIGLVIVALAQVIVHFVLNQTNGLTS